MQSDRPTRLDEEDDELTGKNPRPSGLAPASEPLLLELEAASFEECLREFEPAAQVSPAVVDAAAFLEQVRARECSLSTATPEGVAFPHARTRAVSRLFLAIGRSRGGISFPLASAPVHLVFLIGTPPEAIADYLQCMARLAGCLRVPENRRALMEAETAGEFLAALAGAEAR
jgi:mannitol/fructose-specific phosphotransferase system IIA component (Ntr-type)